MKKVEYKGIEGGYNRQKDGYYHGRALNTGDDLILFGGGTPEKTEANFRQNVDRYIESCGRGTGKLPPAAKEYVKEKV